MKNLSILTAVIVGLVLFAFAAQAAGKRSTDMEIRITAEAACAKCVLKESDHCQLILRFKTVANKLVTYYVEDNEVAKKFHDQVSQEAKKVRATGYIRKAGNRLTFTASEFELVK